MEFKHDELNLISVVPWEKSQSEILGIHAYASPDQCPDCSKKPLIRFTKTDECLNCAHLAFSETWRLWLQGCPDKPDPFPRSMDDALKFGVEYYYKDHMCNKGQGKHFLMPHIKTGKCVACAVSKRSNTPDQILMDETPNMVIQRDIAHMLGYKIFRTGEPCRKGHKGWRYVSSGGCLSCINGTRTTIEMVPKNMPVIPISQQLTMFIGYSYHNQRFNGPDGKKRNKMQFSANFPVMALYETRTGTVTTAADAFISNFC